ncbi:helix-turn-helix domain-containing protein [Lysinibacillus sp. FSL W8-0992]|uniref:helix-turn-helix domain-containing protein n=1 Tax=Lysinibacillus sp. FSL W8-0992 TaxID=2954643 RepID=UPI0030FB9E22
MGKTEEIKILLIKTGKSVTEVAEALGTSSQNLSNKMRRDDFKVSELEEIAKICGAKFESNFLLEDGSKI